MVCRAVIRAAAEWTLAMLLALWPAIEAGIACAILALALVALCAMARDDGQPAGVVVDREGHGCCLPRYSR